MQEQSESFFVSSSQTRDSAAKVERAQQKLGMFSLLAKQTQISPGLWNTWEQVTESPSPQHLRERFREQIARSQLLHQRLPPQRFLDPPDLALSERALAAASSSKARDGLQETDPFASPASRSESSAD